MQDGCCTTLQSKTDCVADSDLDDGGHGDPQQEALHSKQRVLLV